MDTAFDDKRCLQQVREKWIDDSKILFGPFKPTGSRHLEFSEPTIALKDQVVGRLRKIVSEDWGDAEFQVIVSKSV